jgi:hypothetical protein
MKSSHERKGETTWSTSVGSVDHSRDSERREEEENQGCEGAEVDCAEKDASARRLREESFELLELGVDMVLWCVVLCVEGEGVWVV